MDAINYIYVYVDSGRTISVCFMQAFFIAIYREE